MVLSQHLVGQREGREPEKIETRETDRESGQHDIQVVDQTIKPSTQAR